MTTLASIVDLAERVNRTQLDFLKLEIAVGRTFSSLALETNDTEKRARNRRAARKAFDTVLRFRDQIALTRDDTRWLNENLLRLKRELAMLGEVL
jgi:hypothetical protein